MDLRLALAIAAGKTAAAASRALGRGGGTAVAGLAALRVDPGLVRSLASQAGAGAIAVTGTNGKTTTALMLNRIAAEAGMRPLHNRSGSNLLRGIAAMLVDERRGGVRWLPDSIPLPMAPGAIGGPANRPATARLRTHLPCSS
jgi:UDP-N-acetylmuramyl tripeptide synthase